MAVVTLGRSLAPARTTAWGRVVVRDPGNMYEATYGCVFSFGWFFAAGACCACLVARFFFCAVVTCALAQAAGKRFVAYLGYAALPAALAPAASPRRHGG